MFGGRQPCGFYELYSIDGSGNGNDSQSEEESGRVTGMQSPYGRRGAICKHFGLSWWELNHNLPWATIHKIMVDLPHYEGGNEADVTQKKIVTAVTAENADELMAQINAMI